MNFNNKEKSSLYKYGYNGIGKLKIIGISGMGNEYETLGTVSDYNGILEVYNDTIIIDLCDNPVKLNYINENKFISAPFKTTIAPEISNAIMQKREHSIQNAERTLFIKKIIDSNGNEIFNNSDFETNILPIIKFMKEIRKERNCQYNTLINSKDKLDNVSKIIKNSIGQPIIIDGKSYVVSGIDTYNQDGIPLGVDASFKTNEYSIPVTENSTISTLSSDGTFNEVANNDPSSKEIFESRKALINQQNIVEKQ